METRIYDYEYTYSYDLASYVQYDRIPSTKVLSYNARYIQYVVSSNVSHIKVVYGSTCSRRA